MTTAKKTTKVESAIEKYLKAAKAAGEAVIFADGVVFMEDRTVTVPGFDGELKVRVLAGFKTQRVSLCGTRYHYENEEARTASQYEDLVIRNVRTCMPDKLYYGVQAVSVCYGRRFRGSCNHSVSIVTGDGITITLDTWASDYENWATRATPTPEGHTVIAANTVQEYIDSYAHCNGYAVSVCELSA
jgi:hypothetical protein